VKPWSRIPDVFASMAVEPTTSGFRHLQIRTAGETADETLEVSERCGRFASRAKGSCGC